MLGVNFCEVNNLGSAKTHNPLPVTLSTTCCSLLGEEAQITNTFFRNVMKIMSDFFIERHTSPS